MTHLTWKFLRQKFKNNRSQKTKPITYDEQIYMQSLVSNSSITVIEELQKNVSCIEYSQYVYCANIIYFHRHCLLRE